MDHQILNSGGSSSKIERLTSRLRDSKRRRYQESYNEIEDMAFENSSLRAELVWVTQARDALLEFRQKIYRMFTSMEDVLADVEVKLNQAEEEYLKSWGLGPQRRASGAQF